MLHDISQELAAELRSRGCPVAVVYGPEPTSTVTNTSGRERIVVERVNEVAEPFLPAHSQRKNPKQHFVRRIAGRVTVFAQDTRPGAKHWDHERRMDLLVDVVSIALEKVLEGRCNTSSVGDGQKFVPVDLAATTIHGGAAYRFPFYVSRGVADRDWDGSALPEAQVGPDGVSVQSRTLVYLDQGPNGVHEPACSCSACTG
jgi:hypothetical protein